MRVAKFYAVSACNALGHRAGCNIVGIITAFFFVFIGKTVDYFVGGNRPADIRNCLAQHRARLKSGERWPHETCSIATQSGGKAAANPTTPCPQRSTPNLYPTQSLSTNTHERVPDTAAATTATTDGNIANDIHDKRLGCHCNELTHDVLAKALAQLFPCGITIGNDGGQHARYHCFKPRRLFPRSRCTCPRHCHRFGVAHAFRSKGFIFLIRTGHGYFF